MTGPGAESKLASWRTPQISRGIDYPRDVIKEIGAAACAALRESPPGEVEIGGVLFGSYDDGATHIETWRPIVCEHADGASFHFTGRDRIELACLLELARRSEDLRDLQPVGWFVSHPRTGVSLSPSDLEIYNGFFPSIWQVALVVQPVTKGATRFGFFAREANGSLRSAASYREFEIELPAIDTPAPADSVPIFSWAQSTEPAPSFTHLKSRKTSPAESPLSIAPAAAVALSTSLPETPPRDLWTILGFRSRSKWLWAIAIVLVFVVGVLLLKNRAAPRFEPFSLHVSDAHQTLQVEWDRNLPLMQQARAAVLDIRDGGKSTRYAFSPDEIRAGVFSYARQSGDVDLVMLVYPPTGAAVQGFGRLIAPPDASTNKPADAAPAPTISPNEAAELRAERDALRTQVTHLEESVRKEAAEKNRLQDLNRILENRLNIAPPASAAGDAKK